MNSATSVQFRYNMDLTKKMQSVIADIIRGNYLFSIIALLTNIATRYSHRPHQQQQQQ